ncbi:MAG: MBL fold metallo-hydrolase [Nanohaloarchaea archaeon]|nr:MBL fold metallo-hydrolase [Candidatus Nanohaloarchaea archaeon]
MKLKFLGTGGGRYATGKQLRKTGGIIVKTDETQIHIDPGPGALVETHSELEKPEDTEAIIVSHGHPDHSNDAEPIIEMMTHCFEHPGTVFASESVLSGFGEIEKGISTYHQNLCGKVKTLEEGTEVEFKDVKIESQQMFHSDPRTQGFTIETGEKRIGFWTDTEYSEELLDLYEGCDTMVIYCSRPRSNEIPSHTSIEKVPDIIKSVQPQTAILTHFGSKFLESDMEAEREWIEEKVESKVILAEDGMEFPGNRSLGDF